MAKTRASRRKADTSAPATEQPEIAQAQEQSMAGPQSAAEAEKKEVVEKPAQQGEVQQPVKTAAGPKVKHKLFSEGAIDVAVERSEKFSEFLPDAPPGGYPDSIFVGAEMQLSKAKQPMIVITVDVDDKYSEIKEFNVFPDTNEKVAQVSQNKVVDFMLQAFGYKILPADGDDMVDILNNIIDQMNKYAGQKLAAAVQGEPDVYSVSNDDGSTTVKETLRARLWYVRKFGTPLNFNASKSVKKLSASEKQKIEQRNAGATVREPVQRPMNDAEIAEIKENPLLNEIEKESMIQKGITEGGGGPSDVPSWARS